MPKRRPFFHVKRRLLRNTFLRLLKVCVATKNQPNERDTMATDEELEAKKVNDNDKAPEGQHVPEKKKVKDVTAILERKKAPNRLVVGECSQNVFYEISLVKSIGIFFLSFFLSLSRSILALFLSLYRLSFARAVFFMLIRFRWILLRVLPLFTKKLSSSSSDC